MISEVNFKVWSGLYCDFLNYLTENEIYISNIKATDFGFTANCSAKNYKKIARTAKKFQCRTKIIKKKGAYFKTAKLLERKGLIAGAALLFVYVFIFTKLIWRIDIITPDSSITADISALLYQNNCYAGAVFSQEKNQQIIQDIFMNVDNVGYVTLNFYKGILTCKVDAAVNKLPYLQNSTTGNITATNDGIIEQLEIYNGFSDVKIGQMVQKGDVLVSASYIDRNGTLQQVMPRAFIKAYCVKDYSVQIDFDKTVFLRTGRYTEQKTVKILDKSIVIKKADTQSFEHFDAEKTFKNVNVCGFYLPATVQTVRCYEKEYTKIKNDELSAYNAAKKSVDEIIKNDTSLINAEKYEYYSKTTPENVTVVCRVYGHYDITK